MRTPPESYYRTKLLWGRLSPQLKELDLAQKGLVRFFSKDYEHSQAVISLLQKISQLNAENYIALMRSRRKESIFEALSILVNNQLLTPSLFNLCLNEDYAKALLEILQSSGLNSQGILDEYLGELFLFVFNNELNITHFKELFLGSHLKSKDFLSILMKFEQFPQLKEKLNQIFRPEYQNLFSEETLPFWKEIPATLLIDDKIWAKILQVSTDNETKRLPTFPGFLARNGYQSHFTSQGARTHSGTLFAPDIDLKKRKFVQDSRESTLPTKKYKPSETTASKIAASFKKREKIEEFINSINRHTQEGSEILSASDLNQISMPLLANIYYTGQVSVLEFMQNDFKKNISRLQSLWDLGLYSTEISAYFVEDKLDFDTVEGLEFLTKLIRLYPVLSLFTKNVLVRMIKADYLSDYLDFIGLISEFSSENDLVRYFPNISYAIPDYDIAKQVIRHLFADNELSYEENAENLRAILRNPDYFQLFVTERILRITPNNIPQILSQIKDGIPYNIINRNITLLLGERGDLTHRQNTHLKSVHVSTSKSALALAKRYPEALEPEVLNNNLNDIKAWIANRCRQSAGAQLEKNQAAARCIERILSSQYEEFIDSISQLNIGQVLSLHWTAIQDDEYRHPQATLNDALDRLAQGLYEIQRGYNLEDAEKASQDPVDDRKPDNAICTGGTLNQIIASGISIIPDYEQLHITGEQATIKLQLVVCEEVLNSLKANPSSADQLCAELRDNFSAVLKRIRPVLVERLFAEFGSLYKSKEDKEFIDFIKSAKYMDSSTIIEAVKKEKLKPGFFNPSKSSRADMEKGEPEFKPPSGNRSDFS